MTLEQLVADAKNLIGPSPEVLDPGLITWVNDAYMYMVDEITKANPDFFVATATKTVESGVQEYNLLTLGDFEKITMVTCGYDGVSKRVLPLPNINFIENISNTTSSQGYSAANPVYYIRGRKIGLLPIPSNNTDTLKVWYVYTPTELTAGQEPVLPDKYHHLIKYSVYANYLDQDDEHPSAERLFARFERRVEKMVENLCDSQTDSPKMVEIVDNTDLYQDTETYY